MSKIPDNYNDALYHPFKGNTKLLGNELYVPDLTRSDRSFIEEANQLCGREYFTRGIDALDYIIEQKCVRGKTLVVNCGHLTKHSLDRERCLIERIGCVPLRWGAPRILLATPKQAKWLDDNNELVRMWRLWRYAFDPYCDCYSTNSPNRLEKFLRTLDNPTD